MPGRGRSHVACWEVRASREEVEELLSKTRRQNPRVIVQVMGDSVTPNPAAIEMIAAQTLAAARSGSTLAERPELDLLLRLAGTKQIGQALKRSGYASAGTRLFMVAASDGGGADIGRLTKRLAKDARFSRLSKRELAAEDFARVEVAALLSGGL